MLKVSGSMSAKMMRAPSRAMPPAVAKNVYGVVMTASPRPVVAPLMPAAKNEVCVPFVPICMVTPSLAEPPLPM